MCRSDKQSIKTTIQNYKYIIYKSDQQSVEIVLWDEFAVQMCDGLGGKAATEPGGAALDPAEPFQVKSGEDGVISVVDQQANWKGLSGTAAQSTTS